MPRTLHQVSAELALGERTTRVRAGLTDGADDASLLYQEDRRVAGHRLDEHVVVQLALEHDLRELGRHLLPGMVIDPGANGKDHIAAQVCRRHHQRIADECQHNREPAAPAGHANNERDQINDKDNCVEQPVGNPDAPLAIDGLIPVGVASDRRAERAEDAHEDRQVGGGNPGLAAVEEVDDVEQHRQRPGANRNVRDHRVKWVA